MKSMCQKQNNLPHAKPKNFIFIDTLVDFVGHLAATFFVSKSEWSEILDSGFGIVFIFFATFIDE